MVGREASFRYNLDNEDYLVLELWLVGKRRSDTIARFVGEPVNVLWLVGKRRSDTIATMFTSSGSELWLVGKRRSDTIEQVQAPL